MKKLITSNQKLGEIVSIYPNASLLFNQYKIDYCCGGHDTLKAAVEEKDLKVEEIVDILNKEYEAYLDSNEEYIDFRKLKPIELIEYIERKHHVFTKQQLAEIDALMFKILQVHFENHHEELLELHRLFGLLKIELQQHLVKEEQNLFPLIEVYEKTKDEALLKEILTFMQETEDEHDAAGDLLKEIEKVTHDYQAPDGACNTFILVYKKLDALEKDLFQHIYLENTVLFDMFK